MTAGTPGGVGPGGDHRRRDRQAFGRRGENAAVEWYRSRGAEILERNWRCDQGEIDLIARLGRTIVICEVKTRSSASYGAPYEAVTTTKQRRLRRLAAAYLALTERHGAHQVRFDVVSVTGPHFEIEVLEGAF